jgi:hypothetical protein
MADVPKSLYRRYLEVSEATLQVLLKKHSADEVHHYKPILNVSSPHKGSEGCLPCNLFTTFGSSLSLRHRVYGIGIKEL